MTGQFLGFAEVDLLFRTSIARRVRFEATCHCVEFREPIKVVSLGAGERVHVRAHVFLPEDSRVNQAIFATDADSGEILATCSLRGELGNPVALRHSRPIEVIRSSSLVRTELFVELEAAPGVVLKELRSADQRTRVHSFHQSGTDIRVGLDLYPTLADGKRWIELLGILTMGGRQATVPIRIDCNVSSTFSCEPPSLWLGLESARTKLVRDFIVVMPKRSTIEVRDLGQSSNGAIASVDWLTEPQSPSSRARVTVVTETPHQKGPFSQELTVFIDDQPVGTLPLSGIVR